jgi:hypothetical protein
MGKKNNAAEEAPDPTLSFLHMYSCVNFIKIIYFYAPSASYKFYGSGSAKQE